MSCLAVAAITSTAPASGAKLDAPDVCSEMQVKGERLLNGDAGDFYFLEVFDGLFPVPSFFQVRMVEAGDAPILQVQALDLPTDNRGRELLHEQSNTCNWTVWITVGWYADFDSAVGGKDELLKEAFATYTIGTADDPVNVAVRQYADGTDNPVVLAWNKEHYMALMSDTHQDSLWPLWLFDQYINR